MLSLLYIENFAVVGKASVEFGRGLNVLTGETGAGKSIVIDAIGAISGGRVSREIVRTGADRALVSATFYAPQAEEWLTENGIDSEDGGEIVVSRSISSDGKSVCRVNGIPVTVSALRTLGALLMDVHGQNDGRNLFDESTHLAYLDNIAALGDDTAKYSRFYHEYQDVLAKTKSLQLDENEKEHRIDLLKYRINELAEADIKPGEEETLESRCTILRHAEKLIKSVERAYDALYGGSSEGAVSLITEASDALHDAARISENFNGAAKSVDELRYMAEDALEQVRDIRNVLDFSPDELDETEGRLALIKKLTKKYGCDSARLSLILENSKRELDDIEYADERSAKLRAELEKQCALTLAEAKKLSDKRRNGALILQEKISKELASLSMPKVRFEVEFAPKNTQTGFDSTGCDDVRFLMSANVGEDLGRISKIASGGELSRIMLAMKTVLADDGNADTLIFDEIDTGVSGIAAQRVGEKLASLSDSKQIICVTHLPQIASMADLHFEIAKRESDGRTNTDVKELDREERKYEIARLYGGDNITQTTLDGAEEQLGAADEYKRRNRK